MFSSLPQNRLTDFEYPRNSQNPSLFIHETKWAEKLTEIRKICENVESTYGSVNSKPWLNDCEKRIGEILAESYKSSIPKLLSNNYKYNKTNCQLVVNSDILEFRPSLHQIEKNLIKNIENFKSIPENLKGLSISNKKAGGSFKWISDKYQSNLTKTAAKTKDTIQQLEKLTQHYIGWFTTDSDQKILTNLQNFENEISKKCQTVVDFESNIRSVKSRGLNVQNINEFVEIDCIHVDLTHMISNLQKHHSLWYDSIINVLKNKITQPVQEIIEFLDASFKQIAYQPKTAEETSLAAQEW